MVTFYRISRTGSDGINHSWVEVKRGQEQLAETVTNPPIYAWDNRFKSVQHTTPLKQGQAVVVGELELPTIYDRLINMTGRDIRITRTDADEITIPYIGEIKAEFEVEIHENAMGWLDEVNIPIWKEADVKLVFPSDFTLPRQCILIVNDHVKRALKKWITKSLNYAQSDPDFIRANMIESCAYIVSPDHARIISPKESQYHRGFSKSFLS